jgi:hypothetical protein
MMLCAWPGYLANEEPHRSHRARAGAERTVIEKMNIVAEEEQGAELERSEHAGIIILRETSDKSAKRSSKIPLTEPQGCRYKVPV